MSTGNALSFAIEIIGTSALVKFENMAAAGDYDFGIGANYSLTNAKVKLNFTRPGYTNGVLVDKPFQVCLVPCLRPDTGAMRKPYPNDADVDETVSGSDLIIRVALSSPIYTDDTFVSAEIETGFYNDGSNDNLAETGFSVTNNSTLASPNIISNALTAQRQTIIGTDLHVEISADHAFGIDQVVITATDGTNTQERIVKVQSVSADSPIGAIVCYQADFDLSDFIDMSLITVSWVAYALYANKTKNSNDGVNTYPTEKYTNLQFRLDKTGQHGFIVVDPVGGNDTTGAVYTTQALAEAGNACLTLASALTKLQAYHNSNLSRNDAGGGTILHAGTGYINVNTTNGGTMTEWVIFKPATGVIRADATYGADAVDRSIPLLIKFDGMTQTGIGYFHGHTTANAYFKSVNFTNTGSTTLFDHKCSYAHNCTGALKLEFKVRYPSSFCGWTFARGNDFATAHMYYNCVAVGNRGVYLEQPSASSTNMSLNKNVTFAYNIVGENTTAVSISIGVNRDVDDYCIKQNLFLRYGSASNPMARICADLSTGASNNVLIFNNSVIGSRWNQGYNDTNLLTTVWHTNYFVKNNIFWDSYNIKDDAYSDLDYAVGGWSVSLGCGFSGNHFAGTETDNWVGMFTGHNSIAGTFASRINPLFVNDQSSKGGNTSGGDYHLTDLSPCKALTAELVAPFDFEGNARRAVDASGVYRYFVAVESTGPNVSGSAKRRGWSVLARGWA